MNRRQARRAVLAALAQDAHGWGQRLPSGLEATNRKDSDRLRREARAIAEELAARSAGQRYRHRAPDRTDPDQLALLEDM
jgi:hypothetical protein